MADVTGKSFWFTFPRAGDTRRTDGGPILRFLLGSTPRETYLAGRWWAFHAQGVYNSSRVMDPLAWDVPVRPGPPKRELRRAMERQRSRDQGKTRRRSKFR